MTMRRVKHLIKLRVCSAYRFPAVPIWTVLAQTGDAKAVRFPRHRAEGEALDVSFSGLKTSARRFIESAEGTATPVADIAASFQAAVVDVLIDRVTRAVGRREYRSVILSGGVAANSGLQSAMRAWSTIHRMPVLIPERRFCTDNAAMIAAVADRQGDAVHCDPMSLVANPQLPFEPARRTSESRTQPSLPV